MTTLKCYDCVGTEDDCKKSFLEDNKDTHLIECHTENARCARSFVKKDSATVVKNSCSNQVDCNLAIIDCGKYNDVTCKVSCCDEDECNAGSHVSFNVILVTACSVLALALLV